MRKRLILSAVCSGLLLGCGGSRSTPHTVSSGKKASSSAVAVWASQTQQLCVAKRAAIAKLGYVHITYAGISRVGLHAVKRSLERYLGGLLAVLSAFSQRQRQVPTPAPLRSEMAIAADIDRQSQSATSRLRRDVAKAPSATSFSAAFHVWTVTLQRLARRGDAVARQLNLPACRSGATAASP